MRLSEKVVIVTGAGSGIGQAVANRCAQEGAKVLVADIDKHHGEETVDLILGSGGQADLVLVDVSTAEGAERLAATALDRFGTIDVLVNNVGVGPPEHVETWSADEASWNRIIQINLKSVFLCSKAAIPVMIAKRHGSIVNISSIAATRAIASVSYCAAKAGMLGYTRKAADELAPHGVRVNSVSPGPTRTPATTGERSSVPPEEQEAKQQRYGTFVPLGHVGSVDDIAWACVYLASDEASFVTGQELVVDGGFLVTGFPTR